MQSPHREQVLRTVEEKEAEKAPKLSPARDEATNVGCIFTDSDN